MTGRQGGSVHDDLGDNFQRSVFRFRAQLCWRCGGMVVDVITLFPLSLVLLLTSDVVKRNIVKTNYEIIILQA